ncbi:L-ascorbate metabolism protein UlaG, beta-lactamase superfamily [Halogranum amylolyticum]|uniref:L-ascorbate metabolism protein UlaG, beta-lactamase superfamily n=1 Tax=Halogranum amylolyticum TaxID=660520 RepID=A0A1H8MU61_9EURY|nr:MBL fold metallo-hydrolase [Halogranum amylolyticum]SEO20800.1 L-ascorbate metabolism protein UlaG, beta-lactamase superfamily [Halogranum amylolyticum]
MPSSVPTITYYGLSSFDLTVDDTRFLVDPWVVEPDWVDAELSDFEDVDALFVTHGAYDHLGDTIPIAEASGATVYTEPAVADHLADEGLPESQLDRVIWGNAFETNGVGVRVLETRHLSYFESSDQRLSGIPLGFQFDCPDASLYYVGDTSLFSDLKLFAELNDPDVVFLPIGSAPGDRAPLPPRDAAVAAGWFEESTVVPVHYVPGSDEVDEFRAEVAARSDEAAPTITELAVGDRLEL